MHEVKWIILQLQLAPLHSLNMSTYIQPLTPLCIEEEVLRYWLGMMPVVFAAVYVGSTVKGLSEITNEWNEVSTMQWVFLLLGFGISVTLLVFVTKIAKASNEEAKHTQINNNLGPEMLPLVAGKELDLPELVKIRIDPLREDLEREMIVTVNKHFSLNCASFSTVQVVTSAKFHNYLWTSKFGIDYNNYKRIVYKTNGTT
ncbi:hypothetical protein VNO77_33168 [Canavalia gladiata]|uniref:Uncharacterized protein n=1 Tax=Canavalia gladiata TaxID=3824 RepID=A0AAN9KD99_CANGL